MDIAGVIHGAGGFVRTLGARVLSTEAGVRASLSDRGRATFPVEVRIRRESDDVQTALATYRMALLRS